MLHRVRCKPFVLQSPSVKQLVGSSHLDMSHTLQSILSTPIMILPHHVRCYLLPNRPCGLFKGYLRYLTNAMRNATNLPRTVSTPYMGSMDIFSHRQQRSFLAERRNFRSTTPIRLGNVGQKGYPLAYFTNHSGNFCDIEPRFNTHLPRPNAQDFLPAFLVRRANEQDPIKATRSHQRRILRGNKL